jgi:diguanylate cyclase (GGDEF)-like protein
MDNMKMNRMERQETSPEEEGAVTDLERKLAEKEQRITDLETRIATLEKIVNTDAVTKLRSRWAMEEKLASIDERRRNDAENGPEAEKKKRIVMLLLDIDRFKSINDTHGHHGGDEVLRQAGEFLEDTFKRKGDFTGRWGGEEFLTLLKTPDLDLLMNKFYDKESGKARLGFEADVDGKKIPVTFSGGATTLEPEDRLEDALERADRALYMAKNGVEDENGRKQEGRNQILAYEP